MKPMVYVILMESLVRHRHSSKIEYVDTYEVFFGQASRTLGLKPPKQAKKFPPSNGSIPINIGSFSLEKIFIDLFSNFGLAFIGDRFHIYRQWVNLNDP